MKNMGLLEKVKQGLKKTRDSFSNGINNITRSFTKIDEDLFLELEEVLIMADVGAITSAHILEELRSVIKKQGITDLSKIQGLLKQIMSDILKDSEGLKINTKPSVILVIGVNGVGKTTTIGKLASLLKKQGKKVVLGAADTFRAAAIDQLEIWAQRADVPIIKHKEGSDPAAVVFDTISSAKARGMDVAICDTAGRLHNKKNLMDELAKITRIIDREMPNADKEVLLVLDATTGRNAVIQAREFKNVANITGIVLTKLDGTAKGGVVLAIKQELQVSVKFIGVGEQLDDLQPFDAESFVNGMFEN
jgi:fused signal recognition particle receptor